MTETSLQTTETTPNLEPSARPARLANRRADEYSVLDSDLNMVEPYQRVPVSPQKSSSTPKARKSSAWRLRLMPDALDRHVDEDAYDLGEDIDDFDTAATTSEILLRRSVSEEEREPFYRVESLRLFRQRLRLTAFLGILLLPLFYLYYASISPATAQDTIIAHSLMFAVCLVFVFLPKYITSLAWARILTAFGYSLICMGASLVLVVLSQNQFEDTSVHGLQLAVLASHSQILLSVVLLPITVWECAVLSFIVMGSLIGASWWTMPFDNQSLYGSQLFILLTTAVFVLTVAHFQNILRRRAFDATFNLARSAVQLRALSVLDAVTSGFNRLHLERTLSVEINRAARFSRPLSLMMFDLDNFKIVNDTSGHTRGDEVLRTVTEAANDTVRDVDLVARYGGDEFIVVLPETEAEDAYAVAERLQDAAHSLLQNRFGEQKPEGKVTLSIGIITIHPQEPITPSELFTQVDERLYEAKHMGKDRIAN